MRKSRCLRTLLSLGASFGVLLAAGAAQALPIGGVVTQSTSGSPSGATISTQGSSATITQVDPRVLIDWSSFNVAGGETVTFNQPSNNAIAFNRVPVTAPMTIDGAINANGSVWLLSPGGVLFGGGANVNVGSFLATTGGQPLDVGTGGNIPTQQPSNPLIVSNNIGFRTNPGSSAPAVTVSSGARITAQTFVVLNGESLDQNGTISAGGQVSYIPAEGMFVRVGPATQGLNATETGTFSQAGSGTPRFSHTGSTSGFFVAINATGGVQAGHVTPINLSGTISATGIAAGNGFSILVNGGLANPSFPTPAPTNIVTNQLNMTAPGTIQFTGATMDLGGNLQAGGNLIFVGDSNVTGSGSLTSGGQTTLRSIGGDVLIRSTATLRSDSNGVPSQRDGILLQADAGRIVTEAGSLLTQGNGSGAARVTPLEIISGWTGEPADYSRPTIDLSGRIDGGFVYISAGGDDSPTGGSVRIRQGLVTADYELDVFAGRAAIIDSGASLIGGRNHNQPFLNSWPVYNADGRIGVLIGAQDVALNGTISAGSASRPDAISIQAINQTSGFVVGGADGPAGPAGVELGSNLHLSNAEFQRLNAPLIAIFADELNSTRAGRVDDLSINASVVDSVLISAPGSTLTLAGNISPTAPDRVRLLIGATSLEEGEYNNVLPRDVRITGSLGATNRFAQVAILAERDVLIGTEAFVTAAAADPNFDSLTRSATFAAPPPGHLFIDTPQLQIGAMGRVLQQNTGRGPTYGGIRIGQPTPGHELIFAPDALEGAPVIGWNGQPVVFERGPTRVELFGAFAEPTSGRAASAPNLVDPDISVRIGLQLNGCQLGGGACESAAEPPRLETPVTPTIDDFAPPEDGPASSDRVINSVPFAFANKADEEEDERDEDVAGSGNPDLWPITPSGLR
ncbi:MAG TPA: filamentous hemagglutinin N-terminal domain-containing protein [Phenylobacterium sp.]